MVFGATRALVLGLMERSEPELPGSEPVAAADRDEVDTRERRRPWSERRQGPTP